MRADEHPEELIDRAQRGGLDADEQTMLQQHLALCSVCALQLSLASRFERELATQPRDALSSERAVEGAMRLVQGRRESVASRRSARWARWAAAALLVFGVTAAAAVIKRRIAPRLRCRRLPPSSHLLRRSRRAVRCKRRRWRPKRRRPSPPQGRRPRTAPLAPRSPPRRCSSVRRRSADRATPARRSRPTVDCSRHFPGTAETRLSFALAGSLLLERGRAADALAQFDRHLRRGR